MQSADSIPAQVTPAQFFEDILVDWTADIFSPPPLLEEVTFTTQIEIVGAGTWSITSDLGDYSCETGPNSEALFFLRNSIKDWELTLGRWTRELAQDIEKRGGPEEFLEALLERERKRGRPLLKLTDAKLEVLAKLPTVLEGRVDQFQGHDLSLRVGIATDDLQRHPDFILRTDGETYEQLRRQQLHPLDAWKQKRVRIEGDLSRAMKLGKILQQDL